MPVDPYKRERKAHKGILRETQRSEVQIFPPLFFIFSKMPTINSLEKEIILLKERNRRVEADKAWETSFTRKIIITLLTYTVVVVFFYFAELPNPLVNAIIPAIAFLLSTLTLSFFKDIWKKDNFRK